MQRCGRREADQFCSYPAEFEVTTSAVDEIPVGLRLCTPCGSMLGRRGLATLTPLSATVAPATIPRTGDTDGR